MLSRKKHYFVAGWHFVQQSPAHLVASHWPEAHWAEAHCPAADAQQLHSQVSQLQVPVSQQHDPSPQQVSHAQLWLLAAARVGVANSPETTKNIARANSEKRPPKKALRFIFCSMFCCETNDVSWKLATEFV